VVSGRLAAPPAAGAWSLAGRLPGRGVA
jgi:hypothetical protein